MSDTHSHLDPKIFEYFKDVDEIWHAGDIGKFEVVEKLETFKPFKAVYGNIDDAKMRATFPLDLRWDCEGMDVWMTHIGGYPPKYKSSIIKKWKDIQPQIFICGHSHILKVMYDKSRECLHLNPGACGKHGFHKVRAMLRFTIDGTKIENLEVIEFKK